MSWRTDVRKGTTNNRVCGVGLIAAAASAVESVSSPEGCDPRGQTLDPWGLAVICLCIIRLFKSLCVPEWAHKELYRLVCS